MSKRSVKIRMINRVENYLSDSAALDEYERAMREELEADDEQALMGAVSGECFMGLCSDSDGEAPSIFETEGVMQEVNGAITISYRSEIGGVFPTLFEFRFNSDERDSLAVVKASLFDEVYFFEKRCKRQTIVYEAENNAVELSIYTKTLKNGITYEDGGCLEVEYYAEIRGGIVEHCKEFVIVEPVKEEQHE